MDINTEKIRELADLAQEKNLAELTVQDGDKSVTIKLPVSGDVVFAAPPVPSQQPAPAPQPAAPPAEAAPAPTAADDESKYLKITSPMVGTYYSAPSPDSPPFVSEGGQVAKNQVVCIIEAMKLMNELESEVSGKIVKILVENGQPVEFGQPLILVDPNG